MSVLQVHQLREEVGQSLEEEKYQAVKQDNSELVRKIFVLEELLRDSELDHIQTKKEEGDRIKELESWTSDFNLPSSVWLPGFFNPQSFLTAIMQSTARKNELPLDKMCLVCEVTKKTKEEIGAAPREGAYTHGLYMEVIILISLVVCI